MTQIRIPRTRAVPAGKYVLSAGTLAAAVLAVLAAQVAFAIPSVLNGLFQQDLGPTSSQLTWISDAFIVPVALLELTFGVLGDLFGRKRLLVRPGDRVRLDGGPLGAIEARITPGRPALPLRPAVEQVPDQERQHDERR